MKSNMARQRTKSRTARGSRSDSRDDAKDSPKLAPESGEPTLGGRSGGHLLDASEAAEEERERTRDSDGAAEDFESGRPDAIP